MNLTEMSLLELKALGFDIQNNLVQDQQNLNILNAELKKRRSVEQPVIQSEPNTEPTKPEEPEVV
jgi:hypothetical protein